MHKYYKIFAAVRIILTCLPQTGYIHPDEYFQSLEVITEKVLGVQVNKPWEFNASFPVRSISSMYLTVGFSLQILKVLNHFTTHLTGITLITPYFIIVFPRLFFCLLSFLVDWSLYKICSINYEKYESRSLILSISYIMLVYATHTFSNAIELVLFSFLLYYVSESLIFSTTNIKKYQYLHHRYKAASGPVERAKFRKLQLFLENDSLRNWFIISTITVVGVFNRPTFIAFAAGPVFFWLYRGIGFKLVSSLSFYVRACMFQIGVLPTILIFILIDSFYFGYLTWGEIGVLKISLNNFVVTPWNFIKYNTNSSNLAQHGLHPRYLHALVNIPLLFNVMALFCYSSILQIIKCVVQTKYHYLPSVRSLKGLMILSTIVPLLLLSCIPHQEPRFLIPLVLPLVYLYGSKILPETDTVVARATNINNKNDHKSTAHSYPLFKIWILINVVMTIFYGFIHQGGIYSFILHMNTEMKTTQYEYNVITSHVYSIPESLFLQKIEYYDAFYRSYKSSKRIILHEQGSRNLKEILSYIIYILNYCESKTGPSCRVYLLMPNSLMEELQHLHHKHYNELAIKNVHYYYPHISIEKLPALPCLNLEQCLLFIKSGFSKYLELFSLVSVQFELGSEIL